MLDNEHFDSEIIDIEVEGGIDETVGERQTGDAIGETEHKRSRWRRRKKKLHAVGIHLSSIECRHFNLIVIFSNLNFFQIEWYIFKSRSSFSNWILLISNWSTAFSNRISSVSNWTSSYSNGLQNDVDLYSRSNSQLFQTQSSDPN